MQLSCKFVPLFYVYITSNCRHHFATQPVVPHPVPRRTASIGQNNVVEAIISRSAVCEFGILYTHLLATDDPRRFLHSFQGGAILNEAQRVPDLFSYLQTRVDADKSQRFVLSGSQNFLLMEKISQSLAGRVGILNLLPLSFQEIQSTGVAVVLDILAWRGGYPALYDSTVPQDVFFNNYLQTYLENAMYAR